MPGDAGFDMFNRWIGITSAILMISADGALVLHDVVPAWFAGDPPDSDALLLRPDEVRYVRVGIYDAAGRNIGQSETTSRMTGTLLSVNTRTHLGPLTLPNGVQTPKASIRSELVYQQAAIVDTIHIRLTVWATDVTLVAELHGEHVPPDQFPCEWNVGPTRGTFVLDANVMRALGDVIRPFDRLPGLYVGRTWRVNLFDPLAQILPGLRGRNVPMEPVLVRVTEWESIQHLDQTVGAFRVETEKATAWVAADGRVLRQEVDLPLVGKLTLLDETPAQPPRIPAFEPAEEPH